MRTLSRTPVLTAALLLSLCAAAQNSTISRFRLSTADTAYAIWSDTSKVFLFKGTDGKPRTMNTADTLFAFTEDMLDKKLSITLEKLVVADDPSEKTQEVITGFPDRKLKTVLADGHFGYFVEVEVLVGAPFQRVKKAGGKTVTERAPYMQVTVSTFDGAGNKTRKFKETTRAADLKNQQAWAPGLQPRVGLTGNQVMVLYTEALENALNTPR